MPPNNRLVFFTPEAIADIKNIAHYTEKNWGVDKRRAYLAQLSEKTKVLESLPLFGQDRSEIEVGIRSLVAENHLIFYRIPNNSQIQILRVLHQSQDFRDNLN